MLKTTKKITISGKSMVNDKEVAGFQAQIDSANPGNMTLNNWQTNAQLYKENRATCRVDQAEFEDYAYSVQDQLIAEKSTAAETTEE